VTLPTESQTRSPSLKWRSLGLTNGVEPSVTHIHTHKYMLGYTHVACEVCKNYWHTNPISWADIFCWQSATPPTPKDPSGDPC